MSLNYGDNDLRLTAEGLPTYGSHRKTSRRSLWSKGDRKEEAAEVEVTRLFVPSFLN
jgi:hypothetical protein